MDSTGAVPIRAAGNAQTLRDYWTGHGHGGPTHHAFEKAIAWGTPGDFDRCVAMLTDKGKMSPEQAKGYCNLRHHEALGFWPAQHAEMEKHAAVRAAKLVTIPGIDLMAAGTWELSSGRQTFTRDDLTDAIEAAKCPAVGDPVIKLGHIDPRFDGQPAIGRVTNMRLDASGMKLLGDLAGMPGWFGEIAHAAYPRRSVEGQYGFRCQIGHDHPFVLTGLAMLGVTAPGVGVLNGLPDIAALYGVQHETAAASARPFTFTSDHLEEGEPVAVTEEDVRRAYYATAVDPSWWISELQMTPTQLIVSAGDGKMFRVPFQIGDANQIQFGDAEPLADYAALAASRGTGQVITFASAAESRKVGAADSKGPTKPYGDVPYADPGYLDADGKPAKDGNGVCRYPIDAEHVQAAWAYIGKDKNAGQYTPEQAASIKAKIAAAMKKFGHDVSDSSTKSSASTPPEMSGPDNDQDQVTGDKNNAMMGHGPVESATTHSHPHPAYGSQGSDSNHSHEHSHAAGTNDHDHSHAKDASAGSTKNGGADVEFTDEQKTSLRASLGLDDGEIDAAKLVTAAAAVKEKADAKVAASKGRLPAGVITVEQEVWDNLNKKVEASEKFRAKVLRNERDEVIAAAVREGKFSAARSDHWRRLWDADPEGTREVLATLRRNTVPVEDMGRPGGSLDDEYDDEFASLYPPGEFTKGR